MYSFYYQIFVYPLCWHLFSNFRYILNMYMFFVDIWFTYFCIQLGFELLPYRYRHHVVQSPTLKRSPLVFATETLKIAPNCWVPMDLYAVLGINLYGLQMSGPLYPSLELLQTCFPVYWMYACHWKVPHYCPNFLAFLCLWQTLCMRILKESHIKTK